MGNGFYDDDDLDDNGQEITPLVKQLRAQLKAKDKELDGLRSEVETFRTQTRTQSLAQLLEAKGVNPKAAKYFPKDSEPNEENLAKWLEEDGELFAPAAPKPETPATAEDNPGAQAPAGQQQTDPTSPTPEWAAQFMRAQQADAAGDVSSPSNDTQKQASLVDAFKNAGSSQDFLRYLQSGGQPT